MEGSSSKPELGETSGTNTTAETSTTSSSSSKQPPAPGGALSSTSSTSSHSADNPEEGPKLLDALDLQRLRSISDDDWRALISSSSSSSSSGTGTDTGPGSFQNLPFLFDLPIQTNLSRSLEFLPPLMSELKVLLLGSNWSERSSVGNFILGETKFSTDEEPLHSQEERGQIQGKDFVLINTPDPKLHTAPGPHVLLLVLQPEDFSEDQKLSLCEDLERLSHRSYHHSLILISTPRHESPGFMETYRQHPPLKEMIRKCQYRYLWRKDLELEELLTRFDQIVRENNGECMTLL